ncbi:hypothetical protein BDQ17DRAFT_1435488 [Cyathus striatus]|nr:hypothetical protein BDQ17DRAFT_1435488 [Cyathus striatus]
MDTNDIFTDIVFFLSPTYPPLRAQQLRHVMIAHGATEASRPSDTRITHAISDSWRFEGWRDVQREGVVVVTDKWVERSVILSKPQPHQYYSTHPTKIFSGVIGTSANLPSSDIEVLSAGLSALGGQWRPALTREITHLFSLSSAGEKYSTAMQIRSIKVVVPHWFDDCVRLGVRVPEEAYEWPDPAVLDNSGVALVGVESAASERKLLLKGKEKEGGMMGIAAKYTPDLHAPSSTLPPPPTPEEMQVEVWNGRRIMLSYTLELGGSRRQAIEAGIIRAGGVIVRIEDGDEVPGGADEERKAREKERDRREARALGEGEGVDVYVTRWRGGRGYSKAYALGKIIGTLAWLFHVQASGVFTSPLDQLLHYPVPRREIPGFKGHEITLTNYTGEAREYLKKLITAMGATFTPSMTGKNTVLIAAFLSGTKATKALSWSIPVVNHTWLEDCFVQWRNLTVAREKYIVFPPGVDFGKVLESGRGVEVGELEGEESFSEGEEREKVGEGVDGEGERSEGEVENLVHPSVTPGSGSQEKKRGLGPQASKLFTDVDLPIGERVDDTFMDVDLEVGEEGEMEFEEGVALGGSLPSLDPVPVLDDERAAEPPVSSISSPEPEQRQLEHEDEEEQPTESPKKRRRPRKVSSADAMRLDEKPTETPKKRGRPRKMSIVDDAEEGVSTEEEGEEGDDEMETFVKTLARKVERLGKDAEEGEEGETPVRKSGRPRKEPVQDEEEEPLEKSIDTPARKRGHPRTEPVEEEKPARKSKSTPNVKSSSKHGRRGKPTPSKAAVDEEYEDSGKSKSTPSVKSSSKHGGKEKPTPSKAAVGLEYEESEESEPAKKSAGKRKSRTELKSPSKSVSKSKARARNLPSESDLSSASDEEGGGGGTKRTSWWPRKKDAGSKAKGKSKKDVFMDDDASASSSEDQEEEEREEEPKEPLKLGSARKKYTSIAMRRAKRERARERERRSESSSEEEKPKGRRGGGRRRVIAREHVVKKGRKQAQESGSEERADDGEEEQGEGSIPTARARMRGARRARVKPRLWIPTRKRTRGHRNRPRRKVEFPTCLLRPRFPPLRMEEAPKRPGPRKKESPKKAMVARTETEADTDAMSVDEPPRKRNKNLPGQPPPPPPPVTTEKKSLLDRKKGDARTRIRRSLGKKKGLLESSDQSEAEEVEVKGRKGKKKAQESEDEAPKKKRGREASSSKKPVAKEAPKAKEMEKSKPVVKSLARIPIVLMPNLDFSTPPQNVKGKGKADEPTDTEESDDESPTKRITRMESIRVTATERPSASASPSKIKSKSSLKAAPTQASSSRVRGFSPAPASSPLSELSGAPPRRNAAAKASQRLKDTVMPDVMNFEQEMRKARKSGNFTPIQERKDGSSAILKKRGSDMLEKDGELEREVKKRKMEPEKEKTSVVRGSVKGKGRAREAEESEEEAPQTTSVKSAKGRNAKNSSPTKTRAPPAVVLATTQVILTDDVTKALTKLGVKTTEKPGECTHLLANHLVRTEKFICAVAMGAHIITEKWAVDSAKTKKLLPEHDYPLKDKEGEKRFKINLEEVLRRSQSNPSALLRGKTFYVTPKVGIDHKLLKNVITACGGQLNVQKPTIRILSASEDRHVISCPEDASIWRPLSNHNFAIYLPELVLMGALKQELDWDDESLKVSGSF